MTVILLANKVDPFSRSNVLVLCFMSLYDYTKEKHFKSLQLLDL